MSQVIGTLGSLEVLGIQFTHVRGVSPGIGVVRLIPEDTFDRFVGDLLVEDSLTGNQFSASDMAVAACPLRRKDGREGWRWDAVVFDRRWKWRYARISGEYNRRLCDGSIDPTTKKTAEELATLLFEALGETTFDVSHLPSGSFPYCNWDDAFARLELQWLCDRYTATIAPTTTDTFKVVPLMAAASLPSGGVEITPPDFSYKPAVMPSRVQVEGPGKLYQDWVDLRAVAMDTTGDIDDPGAMSYLPQNNWPGEWPNAFGGVAIDQRHLAFQTMYRLYHPVDNEIILLGHVAESATNKISGRYHCLPSQIRGEFCALDDLGVTTGPLTIFNGPFTVRDDWNVVEFPYPVYQIDGSIYPATLQINTAYRKVHAVGQPKSGQDIDVYTLDEDVSEAVRETKPRVLRHPELQWVEIINGMYGAAAGENRSDLDAEANEYLSAALTGYAYDKAQEVVYDGLPVIDMTGPVFQVVYQIGNNRPAATRVGVNMECDIFAPNWQQQREGEQLSQLAEMILT